MLIRITRHDQLKQAARTIYRVYWTEFSWHSFVDFAFAGLMDAEGKAALKQLGKAWKKLEEAYSHVSTLSAERRIDRVNAQIEAQLEHVRLPVYVWVETEGSYEGSVDVYREQDVLFSRRKLKQLERREDRSKETGDECDSK